MSKYRSGEQQWSDDEGPESPLDSAPTSDWRGDRGRGSARPARSKDDWRRDTAPETSPIPNSVKVGTLVVLGLVGVGIFLWFIPPRDRATPMVCVAVTELEMPIPPNALALEDRARLTNLQETSKGNIRARWPIENRRYFWIGSDNQFDDFQRSVSQQGSSGLYLSKDQLGLLTNLVRFIRPGGPDKNMILIYLSAHGVVDSRGEPCLLMSDSDPLDDSTWQPVRPLLDQLSQVNEQHEGENPTKVLLLLDSGRIVADWQLGVLHNGFPELLKQAYEDGQREHSEYEHLTIINSTGLGQRGWDAPELGGSAFGYFVHQGLLGAADGTPLAGNEKQKGTVKQADNHVSLLELHRYVADRVADWVSKNRDDRQLPLLIPDNAADIRLVYVTDRNPDDGEQLRRAREEFAERLDAKIAGKEQLEDLWIQHDKILRDSAEPSGDEQVADNGSALPSPIRLWPVKWAQLQRRLVRLNRLAISGAAYADEFNEELKAANAQLGEFEDARFRQIPTYPPMNLHLAGLSQQPLPQEDRQRLQRQREQWREGQPDRSVDESGAATASAPQEESSSENSQAPQEKPVAERDRGQKSATSDEARDAATSDGEKDQNKEPAPAADEEPLIESHAGAALVAIDWLLSKQKGVTRQDLQRAVDYISAAEPPRGSSPETIEAHFTRMLLSHLDWAHPAMRSSLPADLQEAIGARRTAELAATPGDERLWRGLVPQLHQADQLRRLNEDGLFADLGESAQGDRGFVQQYERLKADADQAAEALAGCDRILDRSPYLLQWYYLHLHNQFAAGSQGSASVDAESLPDALENLRRGVQEAWKTGRWPAENTSLESLNQLAADIDSIYGEVSRDPLGPAKHDANRAKLQMQISRFPLLRGYQQVSLLGKYRDFIADSSRGGPAFGGNVSPSKTKDERSSKDDGKTPEQSHLEREDRFLDYLARSDLHPAARYLMPSLEAMLGATADVESLRRSSVGTDEADVQAEQRRNRLRALAQQGGRLRAGLRESGAALTDRINDFNSAWLDEKVTDQVRQPLAQAAFWSRRLAAVSPLRSLDADDEPAHRLAEFDRSHILASHAHRALDDFWAGAPQRARRGQPYFAETAETFIAAAQRINHGGLSRSWDGDRYVDLNALLRERVDAAETWITLVADDIQEDPSGDLSRSQHSVLVEASSGLPEGKAAMWIGLDRSSDPDGAAVLQLHLADEKIVRRRSFAMPGDSTARTLTNAISPDSYERLTESESMKLRLTSSPLRATALYRGHRKSARVGVQRAKPVRFDRVEYTMPKTIPPQITVSAEKMPAPRVMFIFDCSYSMRELISAEGRQVRRIDQAAKTLLQVLNELDNGSVQVGLRLFAHRMAWRNDPLRVQWSGVGQQKKDLKPGTDVEPVEMGRETFVPLDDSVRQRISSALQNVQPWGETPLYYSLTRSLEEDFGKYTVGDPPQQIVVITDGHNEVFNRVVRSVALGDGLEKYELTEAELKEHTDVIKMLADRRVRIDIVGVDMEKVEQEHRLEVGQLRSIAEHTDSGGRYVNASNAAELLDVLRELIRTPNVRLQHAGEDVDETPGSEQEEAKREKTWRLEYSPTPRRYQLRVENAVASPAHVELEGSEHLQLDLVADDEAGTRFRFQHRRFSDPYMRQNFDNVPGGLGDPREYRVTAYQPQKVGTGRVFRFSIQNQQWRQFTPRPQEVWAEITPIFPPGDPQYVPRFVFYECRFQPRQPVAVLQFEVTSWPESAEQAQVVLWFRSDAVESNHSEAMPTDTTEPLGLDGKDWGAAGVKLSARLLPRENDASPWHFEVVETHQADPHSLKVTMTPTPSRVVRKYNVEEGRVMSEFVYIDSPNRDGMRPTLHVTTRKKIQYGAAHLPDQPIVVKVPQQ